MKCDVLSRGNGGIGHDTGRICKLSMTRIESHGNSCRLGKGSDISEMGMMHKDN